MAPGFENWASVWSPRIWRLLKLGAKEGIDSSAILYYSLLRSPDQAKRASSSNDEDTRLDSTRRLRLQAQPRTSEPSPKTGNRNKIWKLQCPLGPWRNPRTAAGVHREACGKKPWPGNPPHLTSIYLYLYTYIYIYIYIYICSPPPPQGSTLSWFLGHGAHENTVMLKKVEKFPTLKLTKHCNAQKIPKIPKVWHLWPGRRKIL